MRKIRGRQWWPSEYMDEAMPASMAAPEDWLRPMPDGAPGFTVASPYHDDVMDEAEHQWKFEPLQNGQKLEFCYCDDLGDVVLSIAADGTFVILEGKVHPEATNFWEWFNNEGPNGDTIEEFAREYAESEGASGNVDVGMANWSHTQTFLVKIEGEKISLVQAGTA